MTPDRPANPRVFVDADVLFAGSAAPGEHGASLVLLRMAEITLIDALTCQQVIDEVERNLQIKLPRAIPAFHTIVERCLEVVPNPAQAELEACRGCAHPLDLPILAAAIKHECAWLVTFNLRHFQPGHPDIRVVNPGELILAVRDLLTRLKRS